MNIAVLHLDLVTYLQRCRHIEVLKNNDHDYCADAAEVDDAERRLHNHMHHLGSLGPIV